MSENSQVTNPLLDYVIRVKKGYGYKTHGSIYAKLGNPDLILCIGGLFVGIECKLPGERPTTIQSVRLREIRQAGGRSYVVDDFEIGKLLIDWLFSEADRLGSRFITAGPVTSFAPPTLRGELEAPTSEPVPDMGEQPKRVSVRKRGASNTWH